VALKCTINAGFGESVLEQMARCDTHVQRKSLAIGSHV
jgi:hypothetical protein